jgi:heterodisulfide reductase subunit A-like polyferredoxin
VRPPALRFLQVAKEHGLGDYDAESIKVVGALTPIPDFKLPAGTAHDAVHIRELMESRAAMRPQVDPALCTACETCVEQCPASALAMKDGFPVADPSKCLACFCCQEMCPEKAMSLR